MAEIRKTITLQEFDFLRAYIDIASPSFGNAYQSALKAGYSKAYSRVIGRNYPIMRRIWLKNAIKDEKLTQMIEATRHLDFGTPIVDEAKVKRIIRKNKGDLLGMNAKEVISALDQLLGKRV